MSRTPRRVVTIFLIVAITACATYGHPVLPSLDSGWTREELRSRAFAWACEPASCNRTWRTPRGPLALTTRVKTYGLHEIPGWNRQSTAARVASGLAEAILRRNGWTTESVEIGLGTRTISDSGSPPWELRCSVYWIDDLEEEYSKSEDDHVARSIRRSEGAGCRAVDLRDTSRVLWRFRGGIAPPRDSLAAIHDSVAAADPRLVSAAPPMALERLANDGTVEALYTVDAEPGQQGWSPRPVVRSVHVRRAPDAPPIGVIHRTDGAVLDLAPEATGEEIRILRLLTALMAVSFSGVVD